MRDNPMEAAAGSVRMPAFREAGRPTVKATKPAAGYQAASIILITREAVLAQVVVCSPSWFGQALEGPLREPGDPHPMTEP